MSEAFIVRRGGSTKLFAAIGVSYPEGSTCTCTDGIKSFTAKDTSGRWIFPIPYAGTWTLSCTDGSETDTKTVEITIQGQSVNVELSYWNGEIYDSGNEYNDKTGGWERKAYNSTSGTFTINDTEMVISGKETNICIGLINPSEEVSPALWNKISITYEVRTKAASQIGVGTVPSFPLPSSGIAGFFSAQKNAASSELNVGTYTLECDISSITDGHYLFRFLGNGSQAAVKKVWLS